MATKGLTFTSKPDAQGEPDSRQGWHAGTADSGELGTDLGRLSNVAKEVVRGLVQLNETLRQRALV